MRVDDVTFFTAAETKDLEMRELLVALVGSFGEHDLENLIIVIRKGIV